MPLATGFPFLLTVQSTLIRFLICSAVFIIIFLDYYWLFLSFVSNPFDSFCLCCVFNQIDTLSLFASFPLAVFFCSLFAFAFKLHWIPKFENDSPGFSLSIWGLLGTRIVGLAWTLHRLDAKMWYFAVTIPKSCKSREREYDTRTF